MKKLLSILLFVTLLLSLAACTDPVIGGPAAESGGAGEGTVAAPSRTDAVITLKGDTASYPGGGVSIKGSVVTIGAPGEYTVRGTLNDGQIVVDLRENPGKVTLILDGADVTCLTGSAIYVEQAKEVDLVLAAGSENRVVSGTEADLDAHNDQSSGAAIFSEDDLDIQGEGSLAVFGYINNGVGCKDDLKIKGGVIAVLAANNGLSASESVTVSGGIVVIECGNDGVKATSAKKDGKGFVLIEDGELTVLAAGDGVSAETALTVSGGTVTVVTTGDPVQKSCKGLKAKTELTVSGGTVVLDAQDHAIRSQGALTVSGGSVTASSAQGKGLSAEAALLISDGTLSVRAADDGLSSATDVRISGGRTEIFAGADGVQGGKKGTGFASSVGTVTLEGGVTLVSAHNKPVDAKALFTLSGGTILACGSSPSPAQGGASVTASVTGKSGDTLSAGELSLQAGYDYSAVFYADSALQPGAGVSLTAGSRTLELQAQ